MTRVDLAARTGDSAWVNTHVAWHAGDSIAVFAGNGAQGMGSSLAHHVKRELGTPPLASALDRVTWMIRRAHEIATTRMDPKLGTFGTIATVAWDEDGVAIAHAGDARVYRLRAGAIECLTRDDIAGDAAPMNQMLVNAVGTTADVRIHAQVIEHAPGDTLVCCTARVWRALGGELSSIIERGAAAIIERVTELDPEGGSAAALVAWAPR